MDLSVFEKMDAPELRSYIEFLLWNYRVMDAFWFLNVEEKFGQPTAEALNEKVWTRVSAMAARDLCKRFGIEGRGGAEGETGGEAGAEGGLDAFMAALQLYPWTPIIRYRTERREGEIILSVPHCPAQEGRLKHGLGEYVCKEMHRAEFLSFAREVDPRIRVECVFAPPDPHPDDLFCKWRFTLASQD